MDERPTLIAIDPGLVTGWAALYPDDEFRSGETRGAYEFVFSVFNLLKDGAFAWHLVVERYIITPETVKKSRQYEALEIIGALKFLAQHYGAGFTLQTPSDAKSFATDNKLRKLGFWKPGHGHANDAARHLTLAGVRMGLIPASRLVEEG